MSHGQSIIALIPGDLISLASRMCCSVLLPDDGDRPRTQRDNIDGLAFFCRICLPHCLAPAVSDLKPKVNSAFQKPHQANKGLHQPHFNVTKPNLAATLGSPRQNKANTRTKLFSVSHSPTTDTNTPNTATQRTAMDFHAMCSNNMQAVMVLICILLAFFVVCAVVHFCTPEVEGGYSLIALAVEDDSEISKVDRRIVAACFGIMCLAAESTVITQYKIWRVVTTIERNTVKLSGIVMLAVWITCRVCVSIWAGETIEIQPDQLSAAVTPSGVKEAEYGATRDDDAQQELISDVKKAKCGATQDYDALKELISTLKELLKSMECEVELERQHFIREAMNAAHNYQLAALGWELALKNASWAQKEADWMQKEATWKQRETDWEQAELCWQQISGKLDKDLRTATQSAKDNADKLQEEVKRTDALHKDHKKAKKAVADFLRRVKPILDRVHLDACLEEFRATIDKEYAWTSAPLKRYVDLKKELCRVYQRKIEAERNDGNSTTKPSAYLDTPQTAHNDVSLAATSGPISKGQLHLPPHPDTVTPPPSRIIKQAHPPSRTVAKWTATSASSKSTPEPPSAWAFPPHPSTTAPLPPSNKRAREPVASAPFTGE